MFSTVALCPPVQFLTELQARGGVETLLRVETVETGREVSEVSVPESLVCRDPPAGPELQHETHQLLTKVEVLEAGPDPGQR